MMDSWSIGHKIVDLVKSRLSEGKQILELGSGFGTAELVKRWKVRSIEENAEFINKFHDDYVHCPIVDEWYDVKPLECLIDFSWDLLLIDGPAYGRRSNMIKHLHLFNLSQGQIIVVDDVERDDDSQALSILESKLREKFKITREDFDSIGTKKFSVLTLGDEIK